MVIPAQMQDAVNQKHHQLVIDPLLMTTGLTNGLGQGNDNIAQQRRGRPWSFPGRKREDIRCFVTMAEGSVQATHPVVAYNFEAEERLAFADSMQNMTGKSPEGSEADPPPRKPHADHNRH